MPIASGFAGLRAQEKPVLPAFRGFGLGTLYHESDPLTRFAWRKSTSPPRGEVKRAPPGGPFLERVLTSYTTAHSPAKSWVPCWQAFAGQGRFAEYALFTG